MALVEIHLSRINNRAQIASSDLDIFSKIKDNFTIENPSSIFSGYGIKYYSAITPTGNFKIGMFPDILEYVMNHVTRDLYVDPEIVDLCFPMLKTYLNESKKTPPEVLSLPNGLTYYDYQLEAIQQFMKYGRGTCVIPTRGGKSAIIAGLYYNLYLKNILTEKSLVIVPNTQLVDQIVKDSIEYGLPENFFRPFSSSSKSADFTPENKVIVTNRQWMEHEHHQNKVPYGIIQSVFVDEMDQLAKGNVVSRFVDEYRTPIRFGCTATIPEQVQNQWEVKGVLGKYLLVKSPQEIQELNIICEADIQAVQFIFTKQQINKSNIYNIPLLEEDGETPKTKIQLARERYLNEIEFFFSNQTVLNALSVLMSKEKKNSLILFDKLTHGEKLRNLLSQNLNGKKVCYIAGKISVEERKKIVEEIERADNLIIVAQWQTFSRGITMKNLHNVYLFFTGQSPGKIIQAIGRSLGKTGDKVKANIKDISSNLIYSKKQLQKRLVLYSEYYGIELEDIKTLRIKL